MPYNTVSNMDEDEFATLKKQFYDKMSNVSDSAAQTMRYTIIDEALSFMNNYPNQDAELMKEANNLAVTFLDELDLKLFNAIKIEE